MTPSAGLRRYGQIAPIAGEGHQETVGSEKIPCSRPGCYEVFPPDRRWPLKKFCCALCRDLRRIAVERDLSARRDLLFHARTSATGESHTVGRAAHEILVEFIATDANGFRVQPRDFGYLLDPTVPPPPGFAPGDPASLLLVQTAGGTRNRRQPLYGGEMGAVAAAQPVRVGYSAIGRGRLEMG